MLRELRVEANIVVPGQTPRDGDVCAGAEGLGFLISRKPSWLSAAGSWAATHFYRYDELSRLTVSTVAIRTFLVPMKYLHVCLDTSDGESILLSFYPIESGELLVGKLAAHGIEPAAV